METFSELLNQYIQRTGISDAELARTIGVSRQTIFRWREGLTGRPRHRDDVLAIAGKLRLTPEEHNRLLLSAGFQPEATEIAKRVGEDTFFAAQKIIAKPVGKWGATKWWFLPLAIGMLFLLGVIGWWNTRDSNEQHSFQAQSGVAEVPSPAATSETLVLVTHFANYASSEIGYNVAGRLVEALQREVDDAVLRNLRIAIWPEVVGERQAALQAGQAMNATLVIFGEYDVGRVVVKFAHPARQGDFVDPAFQQQVLDVTELSAAINTDLPLQVRSLALLALGQIFLSQGDASKARPFLLKARQYLQYSSQSDQHTWAILHFYLGTSFHHSDPPELDEAITAYTEAIDVWPEMLSSRLNRVAAYEDRRQPGDLELALADADAVIMEAPDWAVAYNNRASILWSIGGPNNLEMALADLEHALALDPQLSQAYFNRAQIRFQQGLPMEQLVPDLQRALDLQPDYANVLNFLCWGYAIEEQPEQAMPFCQQAVTIEPRPVFMDSRGVAYALQGDYPEAVADFETYVEWLNHQPEPVDQAELDRRQAWIDALRTGQSPFTPDLLADLRSEFGR